MKTFKYYIFKIILFLKRFSFILQLNFKYLKSSFNWLIKSKEHTSFSLYLSENNEKMLTTQLSYDLNIEYHEIENIINQSKQTNFSLHSKIRNLKMSDVDFKSKFDYRLICLIIVLKKNIPNVVELGFNQGRIPFLLEKFKLTHVFNFNYIGIDYNNRKGALVNKNNEDINLIFGKVEDHLQNLNAVLEKESLLISTTHTLESEKYIFNYLNNESIFPDYIISDNVDEKSSFVNFINSSERYKLFIYCFEDASGFLDNLYVGLAVKC